MPKLTKAMAQGLAELGRIDGKNRCYWWRPKTMSALAELGLAEQYAPPSVLERPRLKARPWRITPAGRSALTALSGDREPAGGGE